METILLAPEQSRSAALGLSRPFDGSYISIAGRKIGERQPPYCVADIGPNHGGSFDKACELIVAAKEAGADAVKLQVYTPDDLTTPNHTDLWALYQRAQTPRIWYRALSENASKIGITLFSSAFSVDSVRWLVSMGAPAIKIASAEIRDEELIATALDTRLPVIVSSGMATLGDLICLPGEVVVLHCVSHYPARIEDANLRAISVLRDNVNLVGLSDHTPGYETAIAATALGAVMIEKHLKLSRHHDCIDAAYSLDPQKFAAMCKAVRAIWEGMGDGQIKPTCSPRKR